MLLSIFTMILFIAIDFISLLLFIAASICYIHFRYWFMCTSYRLYIFRRHLFLQHDMYIYLVAFFKNVDYF